MSTFRILGIVLIVIGAISLIYGGITYTTKKDVVDMGPVEIEATQRERIPLPPVLGAVALVVGILLVASGRRRPRSDV